MCVCAESTEIFLSLSKKSWLVIYERTENDKDGEVIGSLRGKRNREDDDDDDLDDDEYDDDAGLEVEGAEGAESDNGEQQEMVVDGDDSEQGSSDVDEEQVSMRVVIYSRKTDGFFFLIG